MRVLLKILVFSILFLGFYDGLQAQRKFSKKDLPPGVSKFVQYPSRDTVIVKGSEVNWSFVFCEAITFIEIEGVGRTAQKDIKAGEWHVTTKPMKTTTYNIISIRNGTKELSYRSVRVVDSAAEQKRIWDEMEQERKKEVSSKRSTLKYSKRRF